VQKLVTAVEMNKTQLTWAFDVDDIMNVSTVDGCCWSCLWSLNLFFDRRFTSKLFT